MSDYEEGRRPVAGTLISDFQPPEPWQFITAPQKDNLLFHQHRAGILTGIHRVREVVLTSNEGRLERAGPTDRKRTHQPSGKVRLQRESRRVSTGVSLVYRVYSPCFPIPLDFSALSELF